MPIKRDQNRYYVTLGGFVIYAGTIDQIAYVFDQERLQISNKVHVAKMGNFKLEKLMSMACYIVTREQYLEALEKYYIREKYEFDDEIYERGNDTNGGTKS